MAANPRKFSEKIALMRAKEAEADAAFQQILTEVSGITKTSDSNTPNIPPYNSPYPPFKTGSLPNINHSLRQQQMQQQRHHSPTQGQMHSPHPVTSQPHASASSGIDLKSAINDLNSLNGGDMKQRRFVPPQYPDGRPGVLRPTRRGTSDHAPYAPYLTPPPLNAADWKKFKSDSDIHGSVKHQPPASSVDGPGHSGLISPIIHRRVLEVGGNGANNSMIGGGHAAAAKFADGFSINGLLPMHLQMGSTGGLPAPPHMSLQHASQHHGSLPDLSNLGFTNGPVQPLTNNLSHGPCSPPNDGLGRLVNTSMPPPDSPSALRPNNGRQPSPLVGSPTQVVKSPAVPQHFQYLPQQGMPMHPLSGIAPPAHLTNTDNMPHSIPTSHPPKSPANLEKQLVNEAILRRISDKRLAQQQAQQYRQSVDNAPSPSSPTTPPLRSPESVSGNSQHGEPNNINYALSPGSHSTLQQQFDQVKMEGSSAHVTNQFTNGNPSESPFIHDHRPPMRQHSIPNIVLTAADDNYGPIFDKEFRPSMTMSESFDANEMFGIDEQFRADLTPINLQDLQMLEDPTNVLTDPNTEDQLRL